jgi:hypothetical protein
MHISRSLPGTRTATSWTLKISVFSSGSGKFRKKSPLLPVMFPMQPAVVTIVPSQPEMQKLKWQQTIVQIILIIILQERISLKETLDIPFVHHVRMHSSLCGGSEPWQNTGGPTTTGHNPVVLSEPACLLRKPCVRTVNRIECTMHHARL